MVFCTYECATYVLHESLHRFRMYGEVVTHMELTCGVQDLCSESENVCHMINLNKHDESENVCQK